MMTSLHSQRHRVPGLAALVVAAGLGTSSLAQTPALASKSVNEYVDADERISGSAVVGIAFIGAGDKVDGGPLFAFFDSPPQGDLSLRFNGIDGRYRFQATYDSTSLRSGSRTVIPLELSKLEHRKLLGQYETTQGAVLLTDADGKNFPLRWGKADQATADAVRVYLNSERAEAFFFSQTPTGRKMVLCETPQGPPPFKFNRICDVPAAQFAAGPVEIQRRIGNRRLDPIRVELAVGGAK